MAAGYVNKLVYFDPKMTQVYTINMSHFRGQKYTNFIMYPAATEPKKSNLQKKLVKKFFMNISMFWNILHHSPTEFQRSTKI